MITKTPAIIPRKARRKGFKERKEILFLEDFETKVLEVVLDLVSGRFLRLTTSISFIFFVGIVSDFLFSF